MKRIILLYIQLLLVCTHLWAQVDTVRIHQIDEVEVDGSKSLVSGSRFLVSGEDFSRLNITDINSALQRLPSVTLRDYGGAGGMKTVSIRGLGSQHTGVCMDGVMLSEVQGGQIDLSRYNIDNVENIGLCIDNGDNIFVPARQLNSAGVIEIGTQELGRNNRTQEILVKLKGGSFGYVSPFVRYRQPLGTKVVLGITGDYTHAENNYSFLLRNGIATGWGKRTNSRMDAGHGDLSVFWTPNGKSEYRLKVYYYDNDRELPGIVRYYTDLCEETLRERNAFVQANGVQRFCSSKDSGRTWLQMKEAFKWNWQMTDYKNPLYKGNVMDSKYWQREYYATAALLLSPTRWLTFDYSLDFVHNGLNSSRETDSKPWRVSLLQSLAAKFDKGWLNVTATVLRSDYYNGEKIKRTVGVKNFHHWSPIVSVGSRLQVPGDRLQTYSTFLFQLYWKEIFRMPTFNELYFYHLGSQNLEPEKARMLGGSLDYSLRSKKGVLLSLHVDVYKNSVRDKISSIPYNMFVWKSVNLGKAEGMGMDAVIKGSLELGTSGRHRVSVQGTYSLQKMEDRSFEGSASYGKQLAYIPRNSYSIAGSWENPWANISVSNVLSGEYWANNEHYEDSRLRGYVLWGASLWREFIIKGRRGFRISGQLDVRNIFNHQYSIVKGYPMPGRSFMLSVKFKV